jgi:fumarate hydratase subunit alpha
MAVSYELVREVTASLYAASLRKIPEDTKAALGAALSSERSDTGRKTLRIMLESADAAERQGHFVCSDSGIPVFFVRLGTRVRLEGDFKRAIVDGFDELVRTSSPDPRAMTSGSPGEKK